MTNAGDNHAGAITTVSVCSYNIHRCVGTDRRHHPERIAEVLAALNADLIALQEVDAHYHVAPGMDQLDYLARATGLSPVEGPTLRRHNGRYGNALLTRYPIAGIERIDLSVPGREPRGALDVRIDLGAVGMLRIVNAHFGLRVGERTLQSDRLVESLAGTPEHELLVVLGDFNEWRFRGGALQGIDQMLGTAPMRRTFPSWRPLFALDRVWVRPADALSDVRVLATPLARVASDHLPIRATVRIPPRERSSADPAG